MSQDVERHQSARIDELERERRDLFALMSAMVASVGAQGITISHESLTRNYEITRTENLETLTATFKATETES